MAKKKIVTRPASAGRAVRELEAEKLGELLASRRWCYVIPVEAFVEGHGFRVSIAIEGEKGHYPTGDLRALEGDYSDGAKMPWFWGHTLKEAQEACADMNAKLGYTPADALKIVMSTMGGSPPRDE